MTLAQLCAWHQAQREQALAFAKMALNGGRFGKEAQQECDAYRACADFHRKAMNALKRGV